MTSCGLTSRPLRAEFERMLGPAKAGRATMWYIPTAVRYEGCSDAQARRMAEQVARECGVAALARRPRVRARAALEPWSARRAAGSRGRSTSCTRSWNTCAPLRRRPDSQESENSPPPRYALRHTRARRAATRVRRLLARGRAVRRLERGRDRAGAPCRWRLKDWDYRTPAARSTSTGPTPSSARGSTYARPQLLPARERAVRERAAAGEAARLATPTTLSLQDGRGGGRPALSSASPARAVRTRDTHRTEAR